MEQNKEKIKNKKSSKRILKIIIPIILSLIIIVETICPLLFMYKEGEKSRIAISDDIEFSTEYAASKLYKNPGEDFVIVNFADTQTYLPLSFSKCGEIYKTIKKVIDKTHPNLITFSGDQAWFSLTRQSYKRLAKTMDSFEIPWALVFGNHDHQGNADLNYLGEIVQNSKYGIFDKGFRNVSGVGNYFINIVEKQPNGKEKIVHTVIMMDSGNGNVDYTEEQKETTRDYTYITSQDIKTISINATSLKNEYFKDSTMNFNDYPYLDRIDNSNSYAEVTTSYPGIDNSQIEWYKWVLNGLKATNIANGFTTDAMPKSTCIFHIAFYEYYLAYKQWLNAIKNYDTETLEEMSAEGRMRYHERSGLTGYNYGFFDTMLELGSTKNVVVGHDHINDFSLVYKGIRLTYGVKTGSKAYFEEDGSMNGGTSISIGNTIKTTQIYV